MGSLKICIPDGAKELSTQGLLCVKTGSRRVMTQNAQLSPFDLFSLDFIFLNVHKYSKKNMEVPNLNQYSRSCLFFL